MQGHAHGHAGGAGRGSALLEGGLPPSELEVAPSGLASWPLPPEPKVPLSSVEELPKLVRLECDLRCSSGLFASTPTSDSLASAAS